MHYNLTYVIHLIYNPFFIIYDYQCVLLLIIFISILSIIMIMGLFIRKIHVLGAFLILVIIMFVNRGNFHSFCWMFLIIFLLIWNRYFVIDKLLNFYIVNHLILFLFIIIFVFYFYVFLILFFNLILNIYLSLISNFYPLYYDFTSLYNLIYLFIFYLPYLVVYFVLFHIIMQLL